MNYYIMEEELMDKVCVFLADGFEEIEGLTVVDLLRRADIDVKTVSINGNLKVTGAHHIIVEADKIFEEMDFRDVRLLVLPGGMPGTLNLGKHKGLTELIKNYHMEKKQIGAICAAPSILGDLGILAGRKATSYPGFEDRLKGAVLSTNSVEVSDHITTSRGAGTAIAFALSLIEQIKGREKADEIKKSIIYGHQDNY